MSNDFETAARAEGRVRADEWMEKNGGPQTTGHHIAHASIISGFRQGAEWARDHLAAQDEAVIRSLAATTVHTGQDIVEAARIMRDVAQEPTDAEVEAARLALHQALAPDWMGIANVLGADQREYDALLDKLARAALSAARAARRDEEKRDG